MEPGQAPLTNTTGRYNHMANLNETHEHKMPQRACRSCVCSCCGHALPDDGVGADRSGVPALSEVVLRCGRGDVAAGVWHLDSIVRAGREAEERIEQMGYGVNIFPPFA